MCFILATVTEEEETPCAQENKTGMYVQHAPRVVVRMLVHSPSPFSD